MVFFMNIRVLGAAALQKYIGGLGGMGTSGVGSSTSYAPKELNKEIVPEKVGLLSSVLARFWIWHLNLALGLYSCK